VSPCALLGTSRLPCFRASHFARWLSAFPAPCRPVGLLQCCCLSVADVRPSPTVPPLYQFASRAMVLGYRPPCPPAVLPPPSLLGAAVPPSLPSRCDDASLLRAGLLQCCRLLAASVHTLLPSLRQSASHADVPRCRATGHPALRALASTLPARCLPPSLLDASLLDRLECSTPRPCWPAPYSARRCQSAVGALPIPAPDSSALCDGAGYCLAS
jgi:hypothetical protein